MFVAEVQQIFSAFKFISNNFLWEKYMSKINKEKLNLKQSPWSQNMIVISKNTFFIEQLRATASKYWLKNNTVWKQ